MKNNAFEVFVLEQIFLHLSTARRSPGEMASLFAWFYDSAASKF